jgi:hypothetical protein
MVWKDREMFHFAQHHSPSIDSAGETPVCPTAGTAAPLFHRFFFWLTF